GPRTYVVAGGIDSEFTFQTFVAADHVRAMGFPSSTSVFVRVAEGAGPFEQTRRVVAEGPYDELRRRIDAPVGEAA
ncbi:MAG: hypothetical protein ACLGHC_11000, partial [Alphaproteobacteria bacterium]